MALLEGCRTLRVRPARHSDDAEKNKPHTGRGNPLKQNQPLQRYDGRALLPCFRRSVELGTGGTVRDLNPAAEAVRWHLRNSRAA
ncbi:hypothetical protein GCM10010172_74440 [Paractinoplanes ferrugineus]|uniref:Uncharacterized protein n=1 Tax=Paractinoplanes ferrugineus TaxID=113564 RepID=A0A919M9D2_9ACTN|nr:hypothetical protein Afe05nite_32410 [Actinoplanes ferrugineus]